MSPEAPTESLYETMAIPRRTDIARGPAPRVRGLLFGLALLAALGAPPASARVVAGVEMPDTFRAGEQVLHLNGTAIYSKFGIRILAAGLWLDQPEEDASKILSADLPRRYVTHFFRRVSAKIPQSAGVSGSGGTVRQTARTDGECASCLPHASSLSSRSRCGWGLR